MRREGGAHTLQATALVNEAYLRLVDQHRVAWRNRAHFFAIASTVMRRILVDHARARRTEKRGGGAVQITLAGVQAGGAGSDSDDVELLALHEALELSELVRHQIGLVYRMNVRFELVTRLRARQFELLRWLWRRLGLVRDVAAESGHVPAAQSAHLRALLTEIAES